ncbi:MAG: hypothetical protein RMJ67_03875 [Elusimicrobiota bacterium]|nr:hypothetical protein [Endomicrobiia bacterium]MDW8165629.1 hypothetical protein [Elusimicrobiota bacterium]
MKKIFLFIFLILIIFTNISYTFQFGFGTKGFIKNTLEKGQEEGKIPKTKEEEKNQIFYTGKIEKFDLRQAKYLFISSRSLSKINPVLKKSKAIYHQPPTVEEKVIFKIKENGEIEEVKITDEKGNIFDVNVQYIVKMGKDYLSVGLSVKGVWLISISTQLVNGSTQVITTTNYQPLNTFNYPLKYLVRIKDGAAWTGEMLPDLHSSQIKYDDYGNYYYVNNISQDLIKLNTSNMSVRKISAEGDRILGGKFFWIDKFGNILYEYSSGSNWGYKYRKIISPGEHSTTINEIQPSFIQGLIFTDSNRDKIFSIRSYEEVSPVYRLYTVIKTIECNQETNYEIRISSYETSIPFKVYSLTETKLLSTGNRTVSLMNLYSYDKKFEFTEINLIEGTTNYFYQLSLSSITGTSSSEIVDYQIINSTTVYIFLKTPQILGYNYSFYAIYPVEQRYESIYETTRYSIQTTRQSFAEPDGSIVVYANDLQNEGIKVLLKIIPKEEPQILQSSNFEIYYLTRLW